MKAISIKQPWASLIVGGWKDIENRDWAAPRSLIGQRIAIHASKTYSRLDVEDAIDMCHAAGIQWPMPSGEIWPCGAIIGTAYLTGCVTKSGSPWFVGEYGFVLTGQRSLAEPIPIRGALGFWNVPNSLLSTERLK